MRFVYLIRLRLTCCFCGGFNLGGGFLIASFLGRGYLRVGAGLSGRLDFVSGGAGLG